MKTKSTMDTKKQIIDAFNFRHACKEFDPTKKISEDDFKTILEAGRLSPSSFGFEPWQFVVIQNQTIRERIKTVSWGAQKQLPTASHYIVFLARQAADLRPGSEYLNYIMSEVQKDPQDIIARRMARVEKFQQNDFDLKDDQALFHWACRQTYIALGNMMTAAALLGIDSCPIEGFELKPLEKILEDEKVLDRKHFGVACMAAFGYRLKPPAKEKTRRKPDEVITWVN